MPEIPDPPHRPVCHTCGPLSWLWSARRGAWFAFVGDHLDREVLRVHKCQDGDHLPSWRNGPAPTDVPSPEAAERAHRGRELVRAALADPTDLPA